jgi:hypothetical protein
VSKAIEVFHHLDRRSAALERRGAGDRFAGACRQRSVVAREAGIHRTGCMCGVGSCFDGRGQRQALQRCEFAAEPATAPRLARR